MVRLKGDSSNPRHHGSRAAVTWLLPDHVAARWSGEAAVIFFSTRGMINGLSSNDSVALRSATESAFCRSRTAPTKRYRN